MAAFRSREDRPANHAARATCAAGRFSVGGLRRLPSAAAFQARREHGPCPAGASGLEKRPEGQHPLAAVASPALPGALHPHRHQGPVRRPAGARPDREAVGGGPGAVHPVTVAAEAGQLPFDVTGSLPLPLQVAQGAGHLSGAFGIVAQGVALFPGPGGSGRRVRAEGGVGRDLKMLNRVKESREP